MLVPISLTVATQPRNHASESSKIQLDCSYAGRWNKSFSCVGGTALVKSGKTLQIKQKSRVL
jgi:hypothetical protein